MGYSLHGWSLLQVSHRPGAGVTGIYAVRVGTRTGTRASAPAPVPIPEFVCITTAVVPAGARGVVSLSGPQRQRLSVWAHPLDPLLPGLAWATDANAVSAALFASPDGGRIHRGPASLRTVSYRPLRRAVLVAGLDGDLRYLKVLRRGQAGELADKHRLLRHAGVPAPEVVEVQGKDVVAMQAAAGRPLAGLLMRDGAAGVDPHALVSLLRKLPALVLDLPRRLPWSARVRAYGEGAAAALPSSAGRIHDLSADVDDLVRRTDPGPVVPAHGDFYEANLMMAEGRVSGLLDVDALGPGHLVDDLACFLGHLAVLPAVDRRYVHVPAALERFGKAFEGYVEPAALQARAAGVALTLVAGAKRRTADGGEASGWTEDAHARLAAAAALAAGAHRLLR